MTNGDLDYSDEWYFFEDDILGVATYKRWESLTVYELQFERDAIIKKMDGAWGYNAEIRSKLTKLLGKYDSYYNHRLKLYKEERREALYDQKT